MKLLVKTLCLCAIIFFAGCSQKPADKEIGKSAIRVVATIGMIADVAKNVGGERVEVEGLMGPGIDPHLYKASAGDVRVLSQADIILYNGLHLEAKMGDILHHMKNKKVAAVSGTVPEERLLVSQKYADAPDPHIWFDVSLWMIVAQNICDIFAEYDPEHADYYKSNAEAYIRQMSELDAYVKQRALALQEDRRVLITAHDAFHYFGKAYGFEVYGLQGISTEAEAGAADVRKLADFIAEREIPAIFVESSIPRRNVEALQAAVQSRGFNVEIGGELFSDAMGNAGTPEGTYLGMVRHNIDTIADALAGKKSESPHKE